MNRKRIGYILVVSGLIFVAAGAADLAHKKPAGPVSVPGTAQIQKVSAFTDSYENPARAAYTLKDPSVPTDKAPSFHNVSLVKAYTTKNPNNGAESDALLLSLPAVPDREFRVIALVQTDKIPVPSTPDEMMGVQWVMTYTGGRFAKSARKVSVEGITELLSDGINIRYSGLNNRAEVEFYGPLGTKYYALMITDGTYCTLILPKS